MQAERTCVIRGREDGTKSMTTACEEQAPQQVQLCEGCLDVRDTQRWSGDGEEGQRLRAALTGRTHDHPQGRYAYLLDEEEDIHLVRLAHDWLATHAAEA